MVIGEQAAGRRAFIIGVWTDHEQPHTQLTTAISDARGLHVPSSHPESSSPPGNPLVSPSPLQVDRGGDPGHPAHYPGSVSTPGEFFRHIDVSRPQAVDRAIPQADFRLAGQGDDILPPWRVVPVAKMAGCRRAKHYTLGAVERGQIRMGRQIELFNV